MWSSSLILSLGCLWWNHKDSYQLTRANNCYPGSRVGKNMYSWFKIPLGFLETCPGNAKINQREPRGFERGLSCVKNVPDHDATIFRYLQPRAGS